MSDQDALYAELKPDIESLANPLFEVSEGLVRRRGAFLPHGAVLDGDGDTRIVMAAPAGFESHAVTSIDVLPMLHEALQSAARAEPLRAIAVCEDVTITPDGGKQTGAIKVLVEHQRGLCVALYLPYKRKLFGGYIFGDIFVNQASPEVRIWRVAESL